MGKRKEGDIKNAIMHWLSSQPKKFFVWANYNGAVFNQKNNCWMKNPTKKRGVSDVIGIYIYKGYSHFLAIEIKTTIGLRKFNNYKIGSTEEYEHNFLSDVRRMGGIGIVTCSLDDCIKQLEIRLLK